MAELEQQSACSEDNSSACDEERVRKLFQACDGDGDGFIDSQDLLSICRELNLEGSVEELMRELGADADGRISYAEFLRRRLALRSEIDALRTVQPRESYLPTSSDNSLGGKHERWEFDSGARDLSPEPHTLQRLVEAAAGGSALTSANTASLLQLANKLHLAALASLRGEILDLSTRLQAVTEERDLLEKTLSETQASVEASSVQQYEERITELHSVIAELTRKIERQRNLVIAEEEDNDTHSEIEEQSVGSCQDRLVKEDVALEDGTLKKDDDDLDEEETVEEITAITTCAGDSPSLSWVHKKSFPDHETSQEKEAVAICNAVVDETRTVATGSSVGGKWVRLQQVVTELQSSNNELQSQVVARDEEIRRLQTLLSTVEHHQLQKSVTSGGSSRERHRKTKDKHRVQAPVDHHVTSRSGSNAVPQQSHHSSNPPVPKVAERVRLRRMDRHVTGSDITSLGVSHTEVAEHLVSGVQEQCVLQEMGTDQRKFEIETERLTSRLEHTRALNTLLQLSLEESKSYCERLAQLVGKYESNAIALQLAVGCCDRIIEAYEELMTSLSKDCNQRTEVERERLRLLIAERRRERSTIEGTVVQLESHVEQPSQFLLPCSPARARKLDLETAVLMQEVMSMREEKADLNATIYQLEKEKESLELKLAMMETQQQAQLATVQHLRTLQETISSECGGEEGSEKSRETQLRDRLKEVTMALERVSRKAEMLQRQHAEITRELRATNSALQHNLERNKHKYESKLQRLEAQMLAMVGRHSAQVQTLKQRIVQLLEESSSNDQKGGSYVTS